MKKIIITKKQAKSLFENQINEQDENIKLNMAIQCFLNKTVNANLKVDGILGAMSEKMLQKFQQKKGITQDGVWGEETYNSLNDVEKDIFKDCVAENGGIMDKVLRFFKLS